MKIIFKIWRLGFPLWLVLAVVGCGSRQIVLARSRLMMGHVPVNVQIRTQATEKGRALVASEGAYQEAGRLEALLSEYQADSEISCLNREAGRRSCPLSPETMEVLKRSLYFHEQTEGAFDIRFLSKDARGRGGKIQLNEKSHEGFLADPMTRIGLGAIAKGYIVEAMSAYLRRQGFPDHLINGGGDLLARGGSWEVGLQVPGGAPGEFVEERKLKDLGVSTSGNYEQGAHILDPRSGEHVQRSGGVTVIGPDLTTADALATSFFVLGKAEAAKVVKNFPGLKMIWVDPSVQRP